ncbi:tetraspanin Pls1 family [Pholiota conissans]|uniref:Tetraspanin Pls1 family n=1 Tax=Pholiota conissans TaxID=109636 RepID=A0A9P6CWH6_9AGAR|nr:tetraspanin Pls1 family [Pholiota conissans]
MVSRKLMGFWALFDVCLLAAGALVTAFSIVWRRSDVLMNFTISNADLTAGTVLGVALLVSFVVSVAAIIQRNHVTIGLVILNYILVADVFFVGIIGSFVWFYTLRERNNFHSAWSEATPATRIFLQDHFKCCGYFNGTDLAEVGGAFCTSQDFINNLNATVTSNFCVTGVTGFADYTLNNIFTSIYGLMAIVLSLLLASLCVIKKRKEDERFKKIDAKRGGRGFV